MIFKALADAGITHAFVNWGNDHPAFLEDLERERVENGKTPVEIITCPHEMVALSAAQGYAQVTGKPAAVIVHVDVGTQVSSRKLSYVHGSGSHRYQGLGGAVHNVDRGHTPVLIFAGHAPHSSDRRLKGTKNEWPMWHQGYFCHRVICTCLTIACRCSRSAIDRQAVHAIHRADPKRQERQTDGSACLTNVCGFKTRYYVDEHGAIFNGTKVEKVACRRKFTESLQKEKLSFPFCLNFCYSEIV